MPARFKQIAVSKDVYKFANYRLPLILERRTQVRYDMITGEKVSNPYEYFNSVSIFLANIYFLRSIILIANIAVGINNMSPREYEIVSYKFDRWENCYQIGHHAYILIYGEVPPHHL
jgi:hypothetical protein